MSELIPTMSDSKWRRLLQAISHLRLGKSCWRFLRDEGEFEFPTPRPDFIVEHAGALGIGDVYALGPFFFRDVETVRWPSSYERDWIRGYDPIVIQQPLAQLSEALDAAGKFDYSCSDTDLTLFAYRRLK